MAYTKLGRIRPVHKGNWSASTAYTALEMVRTSDGGLSYIAQKDVPAGTPLTNGEYWAVVLDVREVLEAAENAADRINNVMDVKANALAATVEGNPVQIYPDEGSVIKPVLTFEPVQAGSGDPYPAGGGKNLLENTATNRTANGVTVTVNADGSILVSGENSVGTVMFTIGNIHLEAGVTYALTGCPENGVPNGLSLTVRDPSGTTVYFDDAGRGNTFTPAEDLDAVCSLRSGLNDNTFSNITFYPMIRLASITDATYAPYSNIRPITGRTGTELVRCGKNLLKYPYETTVMESNGISFGYSSDGRVSIKGTASANVAFILRPYVAGKRTELKAGTYTFSGNPSNAFRVFLYVYGSQDAATEERVHGINGGGSVTFTVDSTKYYGAYAWIDSGTTVDTTIALQLEKGSTASAFEPYQGSTFSFDFGQTVYGGTLDWNNGEMTTPDNRARAFDGTESWGQASSAANTFYLDYYNSGGSAGSPVLLDAICSHYKTSKSTTLASSDMAYYPLSYSGAIYRHAFTDSRFSTVAQWKAYLAEQAAAGTPVQAIEKLPTPTTVQLTTQQITALQGVNTVYGDADGMTVGYNKDLATAFAEVWAILNG